MGKKTIWSSCFECHARCGVFIDVEDGKIVGIKGDKDHPFSQGFICPKARAIKEIVYHPERITKPLLRIGQRGEGKYEPVSWDRALNIISERLLDVRMKWGAEAFVIGTGTGRGAQPFFQRFLTCYGSPNMFAPYHMSGGPVSVGHLWTCGFWLGSDFRPSKCIVLWANNPDEANPGLYNADITEALRNGAKLIVVDPRPTRLAKRADYWLRIRPGTDVALALCLLNVVIKNELYDKEFVEKWTVGFDRLRDHVADFTPERCAEITWLSAGEIEAAAKMLAQTKPAAINIGWAGGSQTPNAFHLNRALASLSAITGNLEVPGGSPNFIPPTAARSCYGPDFSIWANLPPEQAQKRIGLDRYPLQAYFLCNPEPVWDAILEEKPYPVKALGFFYSNAACAYANSQRVVKALSAVDFLFVVDLFHTPTTALADLILPPAHWTEREDIEDIVLRGYVFCQPKAVEPVPECRDEKQICVDLAKKMGLEGYWGSVEEGLDYRLEPTGMSYEEFKKVRVLRKPPIYKSYEKNGFPTPSGSGKVDLYSEAVEKTGASPLPIFSEPPESPISTPDLYKDYPLILTTGARNIVYYHSGLRNIPSLRKRSPDPQLDIHPTTAAEFQVADGEWVWLTTPRGHVDIKIRFNEGMHPKVVSAPHGYWYGVKDGWRKVNINMITDHRAQCPVTGAVPTRALLCRIEKVKTG